MIKQKIKNSMNLKTQKKYNTMNLALKTKKTSLKYF